MEEKKCTIVRLYRGRQWICGDCCNGNLSEEEKKEEVCVMKYLFREVTVDDLDEIEIDEDAVCITIQMDREDAHRTTVAWLEKV